MSRSQLQHIGQTHFKFDTLVEMATASEHIILSWFKFCKPFFQNFVSYARISKPR